MLKMKNTLNHTPSDSQNKQYNNLSAKKFTQLGSIGINQAIQKPNLDKVVNDNITKANYETLFILRLGDDSNRKKVKSAGIHPHLLKEGLKRNTLDVEIKKKPKIKKRRNSISIYHDIKKQIASAVKKKKIFSYQEFLKFKQERLGQDLLELKELQGLKEKQRKEKIRKQLEEKLIKEYELNSQLFDDNIKGSIPHSTSIKNSKSFLKFFTKNNYDSKNTMNTISRLNSHRNPISLRNPLAYNFNFMNSSIINTSKSIGKSDTIRIENEDEKEKENFNTKYPQTQAKFFLKNSLINLRKKNSINEKLSRRIDNSIKKSTFTDEPSLEENKKLEKNENNEKTNYINYNTHYTNNTSNIENKKKFFITSNINLKLEDETKVKEKEKTLPHYIENNLSTLLSTNSQFYSTQKSFPKFNTNTEKNKVDPNPITPVNNMIISNNKFKYSKLKIKEENNFSKENSSSPKNFYSTEKYQNFFKKSSTNISTSTSEFLRRKSSKKIILKKCSDFMDDIQKHTDHLENYEINGNIKNQLNIAKNVLKSSEMKNLKISNKPSEFSDVHIKSNGMISYIDNKKANLIKYTDSCMIMSNKMMEKIGFNSIERKYQKYAKDADLVFGYDRNVISNFENSEVRMNKIRKGLYKMQTKNNEDKSKDNL